MLAELVGERYPLALELIGNLHFPFLKLCCWYGGETLGVAGWKHTLGGSVWGVPTWGICGLRVDSIFTGFAI